MPVYFPREANVSEPGEQVYGVTTLTLAEY
jgi:hypothetical protein